MATGGRVFDGAGAPAGALPGLMRGRDPEAAVSAVVGTVLMLAITVTVFTAFSYGVLAYFKAQPQEPRTEIAALRSAGNLVLAHRGGESLPVPATRLLFDVGGSQVARSLASLPGAAALGPTFDLGESVCLQGADASACAYPSSADLRSASLVSGQFLLVSVGPSAGTGIAAPDLVPGSPALVPAAPAMGEAVVFSGTVTNQGFAATGPQSFTVRFDVDGATVATAVVAGPLAQGATVPVTGQPAWTATTGAHTVTVVVDAGGAIGETDETNNAAARPFTVVYGRYDPGGPYRDLNNDHLYSIGVDSMLTRANVLAGYDAGAAGLVMPPSTGAIVYGGGDLAFTADRDVVVQVDLTTTNGAIKLITDYGVVANGIRLTATKDIQVGAKSGGHSTESVSIVGSTLDNTAGTNQVLVWAEGPLDATGARVSTRGNLIFGGLDGSHQATSLLLNDAVLSAQAGSNPITIRELAGPLTGNANTQLLGSSSISVTTSGATGTIALPGSTLTTTRDITLSAGGAVNLAGARLTSTTNTNDIRVTSAAAIDVSGATLDTKGNIILTVPSSGGFRVNVAGATFRDLNNKARIVPTGFSTGTPASGGLE